jgi:hypothetical protein
MMGADDDLVLMTRNELLEEARKLRAGIRAHRDASGHDLCWHHPELWSLLPEQSEANIAVPPWPEFIHRCFVYRKDLGRKRLEATRTPSDDPA